MRAIAIEAEKRLPVIDEVLRENAGHERLADAALLATDEMDRAHARSLPDGRRPRCAPAMTTPLIHERAQSVQFSVLVQLECGIWEATGSDWN